jgi:hypothetical protein
VEGGRCSPRANDPPMKRWPSGNIALRGPEVQLVGADHVADQSAVPPLDQPAWAVGRSGLVPAGLTASENSLRDRQGITGQGTPELARCQAHLLRLGNATAVPGRGDGCLQQSVRRPGGRWLGSRVAWLAKNRPGEEGAAPRAVGFNGVRDVQPRGTARSLHLPAWHSIRYRDGWLRTVAPDGACSRGNPLPAP